MLSFYDLRRMSRARVDDAKSLLAAGRTEGAAYIVGYAVEYRLKGRAAKRIFSGGGWPEDPDLFSDLKNLKTHNLDSLLRLSGQQKEVQKSHKAKWSFFIQNWSPEARYRRVRTISPATAKEIVKTVEYLLKVL